MNRLGPCGSAARWRGPRNSLVGRPAGSAASGANSSTFTALLAGRKQTCVFRACLLSTLLDRGPARCIGAIRLVHGPQRTRNHSTSLSLADARALPILVALAVDGAALDESRGGPVRVVVPERYFYKSLKWLEHIELSGRGSAGVLGEHGRLSQYGRRVARRALRGGRELASGSRTCCLPVAIYRIAMCEVCKRRGRDLAGLVARRAVLRDADFPWLPTAWGLLRFGQSTNARFDGADLRDASFRDADVEGADFSGADLRGASFAGASLFGTSFGDGDPAGEFARMTRMDNRTQIEPAALEALTPAQQALVLSLLQAARG